MTVEEIFTKIAQHMIKGLMTHEQMADYYDFLGLQGYKRCHEYHSIAEGYEYRKLCRFYINYFDKLIPEAPVENPNVIPAGWYKYTRQDVDITTKQRAVRDGLEAWLKWEKQVKEVYEESYKELTALNEVKAAEYVKCLICNVAKELKDIQRYQLNLKAVNYDMVYIIESQEKKHKKYKKKTECFVFCF